MIDLRVEDVPTSGFGSSISRPIVGAASPGGGYVTRSGWVAVNSPTAITNMAWKVPAIEWSFEKFYPGFKKVWHSKALNFKGNSKRH